MILGLRSDIAQPVIVAQLAAWTLTMIAALLVAVRRGPDSFPRARALGAAMAGLIGLFVGLSGLPSHGQEVGLSLATVKGAPPWRSSSRLLRR